jgi:hypothetical protein
LTDVTDLVIGLVPQKYRRDVTVAILAAALGISGYSIVHRFAVVEAEAATAQATADQVKQQQQQLLQMKQQIDLLSAQSATNQSNTISSKHELDEIFNKLTGKAPTSTAPAVPTSPQQ